MKRKFTTFITLLIVATSILFAYRIEYKYDRAGNMNNRYEWGAPIKVKKDSVEMDKLLGSLVSDRINVTPNPTEGRFKIIFEGFSSAEKCDYMIFNSNGQIMDSGIMTSQCEEADISFCTTGLYIVLVRADDAEYSAKIMKK